MKKFSIGSIKTDILIWAAITLITVVTALSTELLVQLFHDAETFISASARQINQYVIHTH